jgi:hypothetical protein
MNNFKNYRLIIVGLLSIVQVQASKLTFSNNTRLKLEIKLQFRGATEKEETIKVPAKGVGEKDFNGSGANLCTQYIKIVKPDGNVVNPKLVVVTSEKHTALMHKKENKEPIDLNELVDTENYTYTGVVIFPSAQICGDHFVDIFIDINGDLFLVTLRKEDVP